MFIILPPRPIFFIIFSYVNYIVHFKLRLVCKLFLNIIDSEEISGAEPSDFLQCILDDNVYHLKTYKDLIDQKISKFSNDDSYTNDFLGYTVGKIFFDFFNQSSKIDKFKLYKFLSKKIGSDTLFCYDNIITFIIKYNISINSITNLEKINTMCGNNICGNKFFDVYWIDIVSRSIIHGNLDIFKYMLDKYQKFLNKDIMIGYINTALEYDRDKIILFIKTKYSYIVN